MKLTRGVLKSRGTENVCKEPAHWKDTIAMHITDGGRKDSTPKQLALVNTPVSNTTILLLKPDLKASPPPPPPYPYGTAEIPPIPGFVQPNMCSKHGQAAKCLVL